MTLLHHSYSTNGVRPSLPPLDTKCVFAEKVQAGDEVDATGKPVTKLAMRRFSLKPGERYVVA